MSDEVEIIFGADASAVTPAAEAVAGQIEGLTGTVEGLGASFKGMGEVALGAFERVTLGASSARTSLVEMGESAKEARAAINEIGEAILAFVAFEAVKKFAENMAEAAEKTLHTAQTFGLTVDEVQRLNAVATGAGVPVEALTTGMQRLDGAFLKAKEGAAGPAAAFKAIGISTSESLTQTELLNRAMEGFGAMEAGPAKVALAMQLFGRNIQALGPLLNMSKGQIEENLAQVDKFGAVNLDAAAKGIALAEALNTSKVAMLGVHNLMAEAFAPMLTAVVQSFNDFATAMMASYNAGGMVKQIINGIVEIGRDLGVIFSEVGSIISAAFGLAKTGAEGAGAGFLVFQDGARQLVAVLVTIGVVIEETIDLFKDMVLQLDILDLEVRGVAVHINDFFTGQHNVDPFTAELAKKRAEVVGLGNDMAAAVPKAQALIDSLSKPMAAGAALPKAGTGTTGDDPGKINNPEHEKSEMGGFEDDRVALDTAWAMSHEGMLRDQAVADKEFWGGLLNNATLSTNDKMAVQRKYNDAVIALSKQASAEDLAHVKEDAATAQATAQATLQIQKGAIAEQIKDVEQAGTDHVISRQAELAQINALIMQQVADEREAAQLILNSKLAVFDAELRIYADDTVQYKHALDERLKAQAAFDATISKAYAAAGTQQANAIRGMSKEVEAEFRGMVTPIVDSFGSMVSGLVQGTETFRQAWAKVGESILGVIVQAGEKMVTNWIMQQQVMTVATTAGAATRVGAETAAATQTTLVSAIAAEIQVAHAAIVGAAKSFASQAGIPIIGPALGFAASAAALAAILALGKGIFSAEGGWGNVPFDGATTQLHKEEMVLPATIARPMRSMLANWDSGNTAAGLQAASDQGPSRRGPSGGGAMHINIQANDALSFRRMLEQDPDFIARAAKKANRMGFAGRVA
jgi:hypothetical protein